MRLAITILLSLSATAQAQTIDMEVIKQIESSGDQYAYNKKSQAKGHYQITPICLEDYKQYHKNEKIDLYNPEDNFKVANWYMNRRIPQLIKHYGFPVTVESMLAAYNCGISCVKTGRLPRETINYIIKYKGGI